MDRIIAKLTDQPKIICGVCHYLAKQFGWSVMWTRVVSVLVLFANPIACLLAYIVLAIMVDKKSTHS
ncbi:PspC domain-containing protein [Shewanella sp. OMA3-2]|uniref:PspC domain-containing protein n=1 Tax=Shewanella sp. OMA3-2 TaxID=2908650 RepID=UPI001F451502|nr:PspC domain-containing protein [Shewanella sp. OMA3-2]UJF22752.1 PspC domain-containing protein [Shewanella sp. OMA3-2]